MLVLFRYFNMEPFISFPVIDSEYNSPECIYILIFFLRHLWTNFRLEISLPYHNKLYGHLLAYLVGISGLWPYFLHWYFLYSFLVNNGGKPGKTRIFTQLRYASIKNNYRNWTEIKNHAFSRRGKMFKNIMSIFRMRFIEFRSELFYVLS